MTRTRLCGRIVDIKAGCGLLRTGDLQRWCEFRVEPYPRIGDWVEVAADDHPALPVAGELASDAAALVVQSWHLMQRAGELRSDAEWRRDLACSSRSSVALRDRCLRAVRATFRARGFREVETPTLLDAPGQEPHLQPFQTSFAGQSAYLATSPEFAMKRLLVRGYPRIFQVVRSYRDGKEELSALHQPEFTLLEWYRAFSGLEAIGSDVEALLARTARAVCGGTVVGANGRFTDLGQTAEWISVEAAFREFARVRLESFLDGDYAAFCKEAGAGRSSGSGDAETRAQRAYFRILLEDIEPRLGVGRATFLWRYPATQAALAELCAEDPRVANRFEVFVLATELGNAFQELRDPEEQRRRFLAEAQIRAQHGGPALPIDEEFLAALSDGMPPSSGIAMGLDRLLLVLSGAKSLGAVLSFPRQPASL